ncbi:MAG: calcium/sodium antiporter [Pseudomonadota bacterium]
MMETTVWLAGGLVALLVGGELTVRGGTGLSRILGVSPLFIGLTVVAFGSSSPELVVNLIGAFSDQTDLAFGGVVGSNLANIGLVLALATIIASIRIQGEMIRKEIPLLLLVTTALLVLCLDPWLTGGAAVLDRSDALILLLLFILFMYVSISDVLRERQVDPLARAAEHAAEGGTVALAPAPGGSTATGAGSDASPDALAQNEPEATNAPASSSVPGSAGAPAAASVPVRADKPFSPVPAIALLVVGLALLVLGGDLTVTHATRLAEYFGAPSVVVGLAVVAIGTSLPELVTSIVAALRGEPDLAVGNVIGSNLFNTAFVLGITGLVTPVPVPTGGIFDLVVGAFFVALLIPFALTGPRRLVRLEGVALLAAYLLYLGLRFSGVGA